MSRSSEADRTRRGTGGVGSDSPGTTIPPIAAGPVDGLSAVLPAASPAAEIPGFGLDTAGPPRFQTTRGWPSCEPPPIVALPRAHHLHVARPPVRVYENAAREAQRIKRGPKKRNKRSGFTPLSLGRESRAMASRNVQYGVQFREHRHRHSVRTRHGAGAALKKFRAKRGGSREDSRHHMVTGRCHENRHPPAATSDLSNYTPGTPHRGPLRRCSDPPRLTAVTGIPEETSSDVLLPLASAAVATGTLPGRYRRRRRSANPRRPPRGAATIGPRPSAKAGSR